LTSMPFIRSRSYELFQFGHLLMFPIIGLLFAHGTRHLLQFYMLGYWLAIPTILVLVERVTRLINGFIKIKARLEILDGDTVGITATIPNHRYWSYKAGQAFHYSSGIPLQSRFALAMSFRFILRRMETGLPSSELSAKMDSLRSSI